jgi:hypothetical protein
MYPEPARAVAPEIERNDSPNLSRSPEKEEDPLFTQLSPAQAVAVVESFQGALEASGIPVLKGDVAPKAIPQLATTSHKS